MSEIALLFNEDCSIALNNIATESIDMVLTSPPYDDLREYNGYNFNEGVFKIVAKQLARVLKQGGVIAWVVSDAIHQGSYSLTSFKQAIYFVERCKLNLHADLVFKKANPIPSTHNRPTRAWEHIFILTKGAPKCYNPLLVHTKNAGKQAQFGNRNIEENASMHRSRSDIRTIKDYKQHEDVFEYAVGGARTGHPAVFPEQLAIDQISMWTNENDLVLDPFSGSSTTGIACKKLKRNYIGIEISKEYTELAAKRVGNYE